MSEKELNQKTEIEEKIEQALKIAETSQNDYDEEDYSSMPIVMNCDPVLESQYHQKNFQKGIDNVSEVCGMITALLNTGISEENAMSVLGMCVEERLLPKAQEFELEMARLEALQRREKEI